MRYGLTKEHSNSRLLSTTGGAWALFLGMGLLMLGNGLQGSLLGIRASHEGFGTAVTGLIMSGFFAGFLLGSVWTPGAVQKVGHIRVFAALAALASGTILIHALLIVPSVWWGMRFVSGVCFSGIFVIAESWLNDRTENDIRGQILALYMITMFLGMGSGQLMLNLADPGGGRSVYHRFGGYFAGRCPIVVERIASPRNHSAPQYLSKEASKSFSARGCRHL